MLGKCLWKIHSSHITPDPQGGLQEALEAYIMAIQCVPEKKDNRHPDKDPVLEPHYKLVSTIQKLVQRRYISVSGFATFGTHDADLSYSRRTAVDILMPHTTRRRYRTFKTLTIGKDIC